MKQPLLEWLRSPPPPRPATSAQAAAKIAPHQSALQAKLLAAYRRFPNGLTADEAGAAASMDWSNARKRTTELRQRGVITPTGVTRANDSGNEMEIYKATGIEEA